MQDKCVCCGAVVPEGRQICLNCERYGKIQAKLLKVPVTPARAESDYKGREEDE